MADDGRMRLVAELQQAMQRSTTWTVLLHQTVAAKAGLNLTDAQCLNLLSLDGPMTPGRLAHSMGITTGGAITAVIDRLERTGFVKRTRDPDDRRKVIVELIPGSVDRISAYFQPIADSTAERFADLDEDQLDFLLSVIRDNNTQMPEIINEVQQMP